ncbi:hypothetical protein K3495_g10063 [Podosphaera aphanis]|nr:hypothetical protein K3495_g10063 [Podosphaera aphanis]
MRQIPASNHYATQNTYEGENISFPKKFSCFTKELCDAVLQTERPLSNRRRRKGKSKTKDTLEEMEGIEKVKEGENEFVGKIEESIVDQIEVLL